LYYLGQNPRLIDRLINRLSFSIFAFYFAYTF